LTLYKIERGDPTVSVACFPMRLSFVLGMIDRFAEMPMQNSMKSAVLDGRGVTKRNPSEVSLSSAPTDRVSLVLF